MGMFDKALEWMSWIVLAICNAFIVYNLFANDAGVFNYVIGGLYFIFVVGGLVMFVVMDALKLLRARFGRSN